MNYLSASWYVALIEHRLGASDAGSLSLSALQLACGELNAHPWLWTSERPIVLATTADSNRIELPLNVERVTQLLINGYPAEQVPPSRLQSSTYSHGIANLFALLGVDDPKEGFRWVLELSAPATGEEELEASVALTIPTPGHSEAKVMVPEFLRLALVELACAIAQGLTFPEEGTVSDRSQAVWMGQTMKTAKTRDGLSLDGPQVQTGASAIERSEEYDGVHYGMPRGRGYY